jgi:DNA ligase D-like protein (predicted ligase)
MPERLDSQMATREHARFIEPMLLLKTDKLPDDATQWSYELKLDGYRAVAYKTAGQVHLRSRNDHDFSGRYVGVMKGLAKLPADTVIDGEVVAVDAAGRPSFNLLQNYASSGVQILYFVFDVMILRGRNVMREPLSVRRALLEREVLPKLAEPVAYLAPFDVALGDLIKSAKAEGFEGLVAKRIDSRYESGLRSGLWKKMRLNQGQEFVVGGYTKGNPFDALIFGYFENDQLIYAGRTRSGFTPALRNAIFKKFKGLETGECPFANLPEKKPGRWGQGLTKEKMADCVWLKPRVVAQIEFLEWTGENHLRHTRFSGLRDDKNAADVRRERAHADDP